MMSQRDRRIGAFAAAAGEWIHPGNVDRSRAVKKTLLLDNTFSPQALNEAIRLNMRRISVSSLEGWLSEASWSPGPVVAVLNAGNVPLVGLQDLLGVTSTGRTYLGVLSSRSTFLLPAFVETTRRYDSTLDAAFVDLETAVRHAEALIATGSDATTQLVSRRFSEAGVPPERQLLRGTRLGVAVLSGEEDEADIEGLARDVLLHEGRGCRSVAVVFAPEDTDIGDFIRKGSLFRSSYPTHPSTRMAVSRTVRLIDAVQAKFAEGDGFVVIEDDIPLREPCVVRWLRYSDIAAPAAWLNRNAGRVQVVVTHESLSHVIPAGIDRSNFGEGQDPPLNWRPDGKDTVAFLRSLQ